MKAEELSQNLTMMQQATEAGRLHWRMDIQTTEGNEKKYTMEENKEIWTVDECYVSYRSNFRGKDFSMITYEMIKTSGEQIKTVNYVFMPPSGLGLFSLHTLLDYSIEVSVELIAKIHALWEYLMRLAKDGSGQVALHVTQADVNIEEDR